MYRVKLTLCQTRLSACVLCGDRGYLGSPPWTERDRCIDHKRTEIRRETVIFRGSAKAFAIAYPHVKLPGVAGAFLMPAVLLSPLYESGTISFERWVPARHRAGEPFAKSTDMADKGACTPFVDTYRMRGDGIAPFSVRGNDAPAPWGWGKAERAASS